MMNSERSDFADDIVQDKMPAHTEPPRDRFLPWHRVKKEFIRRFQWNELTARMIKRQWRRQLHQREDEWSLEDAAFDEREFEVPADLILERTLKCLVIPGDDLLDVRALWRDIQPFKCRIRYLGFNESQGSHQQGTRIHVANNAVTSLPLIMNDSRVLHDRFESIAQPESQAFRYLKEYGPYHIVNLDLCGSLFPNTAKDAQPYYDAVYRLLAYQFGEQKLEWLLFITTMVEPAVVDIGRLQSLCRPTRENVDRHKDFEERVGRLFPAETFQDEAVSVNLSGLGDEQILRLFGLALGKWLLALCQQARPQWIVAMRRSFRYCINESKGADMLSLAFELIPNITPPVDTTGMTKLQLSPKKFPDERECGLKLAESVANIRDVDAELAANSDLKAQLRDAQAVLLESAGYDRSAYVKWVDDGEVVVRN